jgi:hypothetical protein
MCVRRLPIRAIEIPPMATKTNELDKDKATEMVRLAVKNIVAGKAQTMGIVRCADFRCLGVVGEDGIWRDAHQRPLEVLEVVTEF